MHVETLRNWRRDARVARTTPRGRRPRAFEEENRELRRENARLKEEREILKKRRRSSPGMRGEDFVGG